MNPLKHKLANEWMRQEDASPQEALDTWNTMEAEFKANRAMAQAPLANDLEPGSLRDEMLKGFDPSQETHEEYLQRINLERPFNAAHGGAAGQLVQNTADGSRPGYGGRPEGSPQMGGRQVDWTSKRKANLKAWMDTRGTTLKDYKKASPSKQWSIREGQTTGIRHSKDIGKHLEGPKSKAFRAWLDIQDPDIKSRNLQDLIKQSQSGVNKDSASKIIDEPKYFKKFGDVKEGTKPRLHEKMITKHLGGGLYKETSPTGNVSYFGNVKREGETYKKRFRDIEDAKEYIVEKKKLPSAPTIIEQQVAKGKLLEQPKYKKALAAAMDEVYALESKGYGPIKEITKKYKDMFSKKGTMQFGKKLTTDVTTEGSALINAIRSESKKLGIYDLSSKKTEKALDFYLNKKEIKKGDIVKIAEKFDIQYGNLHAILERQNLRRKIPLKYKNESEKIKAVRAKRDAALKKYSSPAFEKWTKGTIESGLQGGHTGQIYSEEVTPKTKKFTPAKINQETLKKYDALLEGITSKRDKAFKAKNWAEVERLNQKGMEYASATEGYKTFTIKNRDGTKFTWGSTTKGAIDPLDLTKEGITAKEMESWRMGKNPEVTRAKSKLEKIKNTRGVNSLEYRTALSNLEKINAAEEAKLFAEGKNKALLEFQRSEAMQSAKMSKKEISAMDKRLIEKLDDLKTINRIVSLGCPGKAAAEGGRISFDIGGSTTCITRGLEKLKNPTNLSPGDKANIRALKEMGKGAKGARTFGNMARVLGKAGIVGELAFGGLFALTDYAGGSNKQEILSNFTYGLTGKSMDEQLKEKDELYGRPKEIISGFTSLQDMLKREETQPIGKMSLKPGAIKQQTNVLEEKMKPFIKEGEFEYDLFAQQEAKNAQLELDFAKEKAQRKLKRQALSEFDEEAFAYRGYAEGGLASLMKK